MTEHTKAPHHVVIVGAGFGGIYAFQMLQRLATSADTVEITLVNKTDAFVFIPMIHEVATGLLRPDSVVMPLRLFEQNHVRNIIQGTVTAIDAEQKLVTVARDEGWTDAIAYDTLVLATGSATNFFNVPGAAEHAYPLRTLDDAKHIKNRIIEAFDKADESTDPVERAALTRFVIVGGGATGVELAAELAEAICDEMPKLFPRLVGHGEVVLVNRDARVMNEADDWFSKKADAALRSYSCVTIMNDSSVEKVTERGVETNRGSVEAATVIWCAGVHADTAPLTTALPLVRDARNSRIAVLPTLAIENYPNIFVVGDITNALDPSKNKPYPMRAQFAVRQGQHAAENIIARLRGNTELPFVWKEQGFILSLGQGKGIAQIGPLKFSGWSAWIIYHLSYIRSLVGVRAKLRTMLDWSINLVTGRDFSKV